MGFGDQSTGVGKKKRDAGMGAPALGVRGATHIHVREHDDDIPIWETVAEDPLALEQGPNELGPIPPSNNARAHLHTTLFPRPLAHDLGRPSFTARRGGIDARRMNAYLYARTRARGVKRTTHECCGAPWAGDAGMKAGSEGMKAGSEGTQACALEEGRGQKGEEPDG